MTTTTSALNTKIARDSATIVTTRKPRRLLTTYEPHLIINIIIIIIITAVNTIIRSIPTMHIITTV
jgi:hypothetical protein